MENFKVCDAVDDEEILEDFGGVAMQSAVLANKLRVCKGVNPEDWLQTDMPLSSLCLMEKLLNDIFDP